MKVRFYLTILFVVAGLTVNGWAWQSTDSTNIKADTDDLVTKIIQVQHYPIDDLETTIRDIFDIENIHKDRHSNRLILQTAKDRVDDIIKLIEQLDVADAASTAIQSLVCRIYMFEPVLLQDQNLKPFGLILTSNSKSAATDLLKTLSSDRVRISELIQSDESIQTFQENDTKPVTAILIKGKTESNATLVDMIEKIPDSQIIKLEWDDAETFTENIEVAHLSNVSESLQKHVKTLLGDNIQAVGYWFGTLSLPGEIESPIGPWKLKLRLSSESDPKQDLQIDVDVESDSAIRYQDYYFDHDQSDAILSNTIKSKIGKPIIICYNRKSYGMRTMGALVLVLEPDTGSNDSLTPEKP